MRRSLMDAALNLIDAHGIHALSLREAARRAGVSSGAPYRHFADKEALLLAIAEEGDAALARLTEELLASTPCPDAATEFRTRGVAFVLFAIQHPVHFRLMYDRDVRALRDPNTCTEDELSALLRSDPSLEQRATQISIAGQCLAYGLARMIVDGELVNVPQDAKGQRDFITSILDVMAVGLLER